MTHVEAGPGPGDVTRCCPPCERPVEAMRPPAGLNRPRLPKTGALSRNGGGSGGGTSSAIGSAAAFKAVSSDSPASPGHHSLATRSFSSLL